MRDGTDPEGCINEQYLPFSPRALKGRFAAVKRGGDPDRHLAYFQASQSKWVELEQKVEGGRTVTPQEERRGRQMEKDERFWVVAALMGLFHDPIDRVARLTSILKRALGDAPPISGLSTWEDALGGQQELYFEVNLPSPRRYREDLREHLVP